MNSLRFSGALFLGAAFALGSSSHAQAAPLEQTATPEKPALVSAQIRVRNVPSNLMAYWLDPNHQMMPIEIQSSIANSGKVPQLQDDDWKIVDPPAAPVAPVDKPLKLRPNNGYGPLNLKLPTGIETVVSIEPQSIIFARGTAAGIEQLRALVAQLDVPLSKVEVEVQFFQLARADLGALSPAFTTNKIGGNPVVVASANENPVKSPDASRIGFVSNGWRKNVNELIAQDKLKIITAPRVTAISGLTAKLQSQEMRYFAYAALPENHSDEARENRILPVGSVLTTTETGITCTPMVYKDLIQLDLEAFLPSRVLHLTTPVKDGESLAVEFPTEDANSETATVLFVTARIIRRAGE